MRGARRYNVDRMTHGMPPHDSKLIVGAALGNCVHVAGVANFLRLAEAAGFRTRLLGAAVSVDGILDCIRSERPAVLAVSYRLTPEIGRRLLAELLEKLPSPPDMTLLFGGTPEMAAVAAETGRFAACFVGDEPAGRIQRVLARLTGRAGDEDEADSPAALVPVGQRVGSLMRTGDGRRVAPLLRHHFGLPDLDATVDGVGRIAESEALDVISIAPDQNAQEFFFRPERMDAALDGAGGVPLRRPADLRRLREASRRGNHPYLRIYSGTNDLLAWAEMSVRELGNAWAAVPLTWYSELDGRSRRPLAEAVAENLRAIRWYADRGLPVEVNEAHQWSLREAPDAVAVATAYIAAYCAKRAGVRQFFAQYMFNTPSYTAPVADLAKMTAKAVLIGTLVDEGFRAYRQVRAGLTHFATDPDVARGQLAASTLMMLGLRPHILHVVGYCEARHAASAEEVIESCRIVGGVFRDALAGLPDPLTDPRVAELAGPMLTDARVLLGTIENLGRAIGSEDPLADPETIALAVRTGVLDAPHLAGQPCARGRVRTAPVAGGCRAVTAGGEVVSESDRLLAALSDGPAAKLIDGSPTRLITPLEVPELPSAEDALT